MAALDQRAAVLQLDRGCAPVLRVHHCALVRGGPGRGSGQPITLIAPPPPAARPAHPTSFCRCFRCRQVADKVSGFPSDYADVKFLSVDLQECEVSGKGQGWRDGQGRHRGARCPAVLHCCFRRPAPTWHHLSLITTLPLPANTVNAILQDLGELLDVRTLPTFLLLRHGAEVARLEGVPQQRPARALAQAIRQHLLPQAGAEPGGPDSSGPGSSGPASSSQGSTQQPARQRQA